MFNLLSYFPPSNISSYVKMKCLLSHVHSTWAWKVDKNLLKIFGKKCVGAYSTFPLVSFGMGPNHLTRHCNALYTIHNSLKSESWGFLSCSRCSMLTPLLPTHHPSCPPAANKKRPFPAWMPPLYTEIYIQKQPFVGWCWKISFWFLNVIKTTK